ncbi:MAG: rhodanese-like domain-containing protein [Ignavibacteria bacterium]|nr:rhodanese-like domain-containing protein [Ignavibacteria bacterium]
MSKYFVISVLIGVVWFGFLFGQKIEEIDIEEVQEAIQDSSDVILLDVRAKAEFNGPLRPVTGSILIPLSELENRLSELDSYKDKRIIVICRSGNRSRMATGILIKRGFDAVNMKGAMLAWNEKFIIEEGLE